ncbi:MAG: hypothetical protein U1F66_04710 [bacterium]
MSDLILDRLRPGFPREPAPSFAFQPRESAGWTPALRRELAVLAAESDPQLYAEGLLNLAQRLEAGEHPEAAPELYQALLESPVPGISARARTRLDALLGRGAVGPRLEFLLRRLTQAATEPSALFAMGAAGAVFRMTRLWALSRLVSAGETGLMTRLLGPGRIASLAGFAAEAPAFTLANRLGHAALGRSQDWGGSALAREFASSFLVLGALKLSGSAAAWLGAGQAASLRMVLRQGGMLTGILLSHRLEELAGLRPSQPGATRLADSLALLLQFQMAGRLVEAGLGRPGSAAEAHLEAMALTPRPSLPPPLALSLGAEPALASAAGPSRSGSPAAPRLSAGVFAMAAGKPLGGHGGSTARKSPGELVEEHLQTLSEVPPADAEAAPPAIEFRFEGVTLTPSAELRQRFFCETLQRLLSKGESGFPYPLRGELSQALRSNADLRASLPALGEGTERRWVADIAAKGHELRHLLLLESEGGGPWRPRRLLLGAQILRYDESQDPAVYDLEFGRGEAPEIRGRIFRPDLHERWNPDGYLSRSFSPVGDGDLRWELYPKSSYLLRLEMAVEPQLRLQVLELSGHRLFSLGPWARAGNGKGRQGP